MTDWSSLKSALLLDRHVDAPVSMQIGVPPMGHKSIDLVVCGSGHWKAHRRARQALFSLKLQCDVGIVCGRL